MFTELIKTFNFDKDYPLRAQMIDAYMRVLNGEQYDKLSYSFSQEYDGNGGYIPLAKRRPSVRYNMCRLVVDDSVSLLFGADHFPKIITSETDIDLDNKLKIICNSINLRQIMTEAALTGSVGSVALFIRVIDHSFKVEVKGTQFITPFFNPLDPTQLIKVVEKYKVKGSDLLAAGYTGVDTPSLDYWFMRVWDSTREIFYLPFRGDDTPVEDDQRTVIHELGIVPVLWAKNLPKPSSRGFDEVDGACTFAPAIAINIESDYLLSQGGRGLKYSSDPLVVMKLQDEYTLSQNAVSVSGDIAGSKKIVRNSSNALVIGTQDDAKLLEINGRASQAVIEHVRFLRELAMESLHGNRSNADKVNAAQSGIAMRQMNQALIWLVDLLRIYYGDNLLIPLIEMLIYIANKQKVFAKNTLIESIDPQTDLSLKWPHWYPNTPKDKVDIANALQTHQNSGQISRQTAVNQIKDDYGIAEVDDELKLIAKDQAELAAMQPQVKETIAA